MNINSKNFEHFIQRMCDCNTCLFNGENECPEYVAQGSPECLKRLECYITGVPYEAPQKLYQVNIEVSGIATVYIKASNEEEAIDKALENVNHEQVNAWDYDVCLVDMVEDEV